MAKISKKYIFPLLFLFAFFLFLPSHQVHAQLLLGVGNLIAGATAVFFQIILLSANAFLSLSVILLNFAMSNPWKLSYTNPNNNEVIRIGWTLIRDLTNMAFILGLVYIGLATALRLAGFNLKQALPKLIGVALIINFTPVICGLVVDAANIVMNFFLQGFGFDIIHNVFSQQLSIIWRMVNGGASVGVELLLETVTLTIFGYVAGFVLFVYAFLFIARYFAIWILTILSPLAFFAWIFSRTKNWFNLWLNQLFQWSFIGATGGFFLYIVQHYLRIASAGEIFSSSVPGSSYASEMISSLLPYVGGLIFLLIGFYVAFQTSAMGSNFVIKYGKIGGGFLAKKFWKAGTSPYKWTYKKLGSPLSKGKKEEKEEAESLKKLRQQGQIGKFKYGLKRTGQRIGWVIRRIPGAKRLGAYEAESRTKEINKYKKAAEGKSAETQAIGINGISERKAIGNLLAAIKDKNIGTIMKTGMVSRKKLAKIGEGILNTKPELFKDFKKNFPDIAEEIYYLKGMNIGNNKTLGERAGIWLDDKEKEEYEGSIFNKIMHEMKSKDIENLDIKSPRFQSFLTLGGPNKYWNSAQISAAAKNFREKFTDILKDTIKKQKEWIEENRPDLVKFYKSNLGGRITGIVWPGKGGKEVPSGGKIIIPKGVITGKRIYPEEKPPEEEKKPPETGAGMGEKPIKPKKRKGPPESFGRHVSKI